jgi:phosphoserine phosphatase
MRQNLRESHLPQRAGVRIFLLSRTLHDADIEAVAALAQHHGLEVAGVRRPYTLGGPTQCVQLVGVGVLEEIAGFRLAARVGSLEWQTDIVIVDEAAYRERFHRVAMDMDSTLIQGEVIDELATAAGVGEQVAAITAAAMGGVLDFQQSFRRRIALLKGLPLARVHQVVERAALADGAAVLLARLKAGGYRTAVISGGFTLVGDRLQAKFGIDHLHCNELEIKDGLVTGEVRGPIVDGARKLDLLQAVAAQEGIPMSQVVAVGDGANDLPMIAAAGLGVAFHAKPLVRESAPHAISYSGLDALLYILGEGRGAAVDAAVV